MDITQIAYERYKLDWMIQHKFTLNDLMHELDLMQEEEDATAVSSLYRDWEYGFGFGSEIWASYEEFMDSEFLDGEYMKVLLTASEYILYVKYVTENILV